MLRGGPPGGRGDPLPQRRGSLSGRGPRLRGLAAPAHITSVCCCRRVPPEESRGDRRQVVRQDRRRFPRGRGGRRSRTLQLRWSAAPPQQKRGSLGGTQGGEVLMFCSRCGAVVAASVRFCPTCGLDLSRITASPAGAPCVHCGTALDPAMRHCPTCGTARARKDQAMPGAPDGSALCARCGTEFGKGVRFCPTCGKDLTVQRHGT